MTKKVEAKIAGLPRLLPVCNDLFLIFPYVFTIFQVRRNVLILPDLKLSFPAPPLLSPYLVKIFNERETGKLWRYISKLI